MAQVYVKIFEIREGSTPGMKYEIEVIFQGKVVDKIKKTTQQEAWNELNKMGYKRALAHGSTLIVA